MTEMAVAQSTFASGIDGLIPELIVAVDLMYRGVGGNDLKATDEAEARFRDIQEDLPGLARKLLSEGGGSREATHYVMATTHLLRLCDNLSRTARCIKCKIKEDVLFSDKAMHEMEAMFERTRDIVLNIGELVRGSNELVAGHLKEAGHNAEALAAEFATKHEERLIEGLCMPKASSLFLEMLDAFKDAAWSGKEIAEDLS